MTPNPNPNVTEKTAAAIATNKPIIISANLGTTYSPWLAFQPLSV